MANYSKLVGQVIGGVIGILAGVGLDVAWATPEIVGAIAVLIGGAIGTYAAPPNREA